LSPIQNNRQLHIEIRNHLQSDAYAALLTNDISEEEPKENYINRSFAELQTQCLKPDYFYMYVQKGVLKKEEGAPPLPGHIASFATDKQKAIISDSVISLRRSRNIKDLYQDRKLYYKFGHKNETKERENLISKIKFLSIEEELEKHFFQSAQPDPEVISKRFLFAIPLSQVPGGIELLQQRVSQTKESLSSKDYILCDGLIKYTDGRPDEAVASQNCVTAFYRSAGVTGTVVNPSPQMAAWSYQKFLLGEAERDELIKDLEFRVPRIERNQDDELIASGSSHKIRVK